MMTQTSGTKIVLTASATEMSEYGNSQFIAFVAGFARGPVPKWLIRKYLYPPVERTTDGKAKVAPYGLRKVEAMLLQNGFSENEVAVVHPADLAKFIGPNTKAVGISSMDPTGMGYVSKTYSSLIGGGEPMNAMEFKALVNNPAIRTYKPKVIVGGFGSWQLERRRLTKDYGVDCLVMGPGQKTIVEIFKKAVAGEPLPQRVRSPMEDGEQEPLIKHAAIHGAIEISKGCGRNCQFCTPTVQRKIDVPLENIMKEVELTAKEMGSKGANITLVTEDLFLYGAKEKTFIPNEETVVKLVKSVASVPHVKGIQPSHMSLAPVVNKPNMIRDIAEILVQHPWYRHNGKPIVTGETGIETGSVRLMRKYMAGKMLPYKPEQWKEIVTQAFGILNDNDWYPLATLIVGLPEETEDDVNETLTLMDDLKDYNAFYVPLFFVPLEDCLLMNKRGAELDSLTKMRWEFLARCWEYNVRIWRSTFLGDRISNPTLLQIADHGVLPVAAKIAQTYYNLKRHEQIGEILWRLSRTYPED
ncbi:MAG: B12-binding domain-containing radical SAM protein [Candidatus Bathyarchaeota archaeon]|nr:B12-binding domain-containing radical SAM protein [Candidatus Bathyarchaeota archaeon]